MLLVGSLPPVADTVLGAWQGEYIQRPNSRDVTDGGAEAILVLGGSMAYSQSASGLGPDWGDSIDRFFAGVDLYKAGRASTLLLSGGSVELPAGRPSEGQVLSQRAIELGVPASAVFVLPRARDTEAEAELARRFFKGKPSRIILVTSAFHMRRAKLIFERHGFEVSPVAVDIKISVVRRFPRDWLPRASALGMIETVAREAAAIAYYRLKYSLFS
jgi:uncharacterized SAM-binding protein YcdF (DUF218 family)